MFNITFSLERLSELEAENEEALVKAKTNLRYCPADEDWMTMDSIQNPKLKQLMLELDMGGMTTDSSDDKGLLENIPYIFKYSNKAIYFDDNEWDYLNDVIREINEEVYYG